MFVTGLTDFAIFRCLMQVRQGCPLSRTLQIMYTLCFVLLAQGFQARRLMMAVSKRHGLQAVSKACQSIQGPGEDHQKCPKLTSIYKHISAVRLSTEKEVVSLIEQSAELKPNMVRSTPPGICLICPSTPTSQASILTASQCNVCLQGQNKVCMSESLSSRRTLTRIPVQQQQQ